MSATAVAFRQQAPSMSEGKWIYNRKWDLAFISLSVVLVPIPYLTWLLTKDVLRLESDAGRQAVNLLIAVMIGGPHMYATFTRTALDHDFRQRYNGFVRSSIIIPLIVITLALTNLTLLLTIFFFWASIHVLHQILFVVESYNQKARQAPGRTTLTPLSRAIDYAVVLTSLYPIAAYRIAVTQDFSIGPTELNDAIPSLFEQPWVVYAAGAAFGVSLLAFIVKSILEWSNGTAHVPKIIFIAFTAAASFVVPALGNLDTAFQGMNVWHSFQYLALTWYVNRLRYGRGELARKPLLQRMSEDGKARWFYGFNLALTAGAGVIIAVVFTILYFGVGGKWAEASYALETSYYIGVLSFLWIHYYHDHFLFTQTTSVLP
ncbi:MAG: hypothetical protein L0332_16430 [Chloroflexi bacterium]|nr:hypothetical protein [Chloroflexota bacterium]MCI0579091.1 hypothetical protein [Chloroflexota bacterium]MCI0650087.1 hypothetical protein [Chloroflexota bacterium]MCI0728287.1 hypothetical protein [Chloroflexota bacterium]